MSTRPGSRTFTQIRRWLTASVGPGLLLVTPFIVYLKHNSYFSGAPEIVVCLTVVAVVALGLGALALTHSAVELGILAALATLALDVQLNDFWFHGIGKSKTVVGGFIAFSMILWVLRAHAARLVRVAAAAMFIATLLLPGSESTALGKSESPGTIRRNELPLIVHLVLDSHIGIEGLADEGSSPQLGAALKAFYTARGFRVFGGAYSEHTTTEQSLGHMLNFSPGQFVGDLLESGGPGFRFALQRNAYFERFTQMGYIFRIYQTTHLDFCPRSSSSATCDTYRESNIGIIGDLPLSVAEKVRIIAISYLTRSMLAGQARDWKEKARDAFGLTFLPSNHEESVKPTSINSMATARRAIRDLSKGSPGEVFFVHLLLPHSPYSYDANCGLRPLQDWLVADDPDAPPGTTNSVDGRATRYERYRVQVGCVLNVVQDVIDAIPAALQHDAIVIVQGDHGSRIGILRPQQAPSTPSFNYWDWYSALFAIRSPSLDAGYDSRPVPLPCLLKLLVESNFGSVDGLDTCAAAPGVFIPIRGKPVRQAVPAFGTR